MLSRDVTAWKSRLPVHVAGTCVAAWHHEDMHLLEKLVGGLIVVVLLLVMVLLFLRMTGDA